MSGKDFAWICYLNFQTAPDMHSPIPCCLFPCSLHYSQQSAHSSVYEFAIYLFVTYISHLEWEFLVEKEFFCIVPCCILSVPNSVWEKVGYNKIFAKWVGVKLSLQRCRAWTQKGKLKSRWLIGPEGMETREKKLVSDTSNVCYIKGKEMWFQCRQVCQFEGENRSISLLPFLREVYGKIIQLKSCL